MTEAAPAATGGNGATGGATNWFSTIQGEDLGYITNRGLDKLPDPTAALIATINAHRNAEKLIGVPSDQVLRIPKDATDTSGWQATWEKLGRPKDATGYDLKAFTEATNEDLAKFYGPAALKHNIPKAAAEGLAADLAAHMKATATADADLQKQQVGLEKEALTKEWGPHAAAHLLVAQNAAKALGVTPEVLATLEGQVGYKAVMKMFHTIGSKIGEDKFVQGGAASGGAGAGVLTSDQAASKLRDLRTDTDWVKKYMNGDTATRQQAEQLLRIAANVTDGL